ncbi:carbon-nitrogen hydrolase family protein [Pseudonocardia xishanensis]|uniref:Carbon-nitrogen hydrolase family protein n=1 Tax=Pseudonocardia xishanensis TaxID=630995 RepID=A0ABP8RV91_9PSEU
MPFDAEASLSELDRLAGEAAGKGCQLVVFPEAFIGGYPRGLNFGSVFGSRDAEGREWYRRYHAAAVDLAGPVRGELARIARANDVLLVGGVIERDGGTLYCTAVWTDPELGVMNSRRKLVPTGAERIAWGNGDLARQPVIETRYGRVGVAICWENYMPLLRTYMYSQGVEIWCAPTADARDTWAASMRHIALEGRCFVLSSNQFIRRESYPEDYPVDLAQDAVMCEGGSMIVNPLGHVLAGPEREQATVLVADLDMGDIARGSLDFDPIGHYARPDLFSLEVDTRPRAVVRKSQMTY